jgi:hypothetical protein
MEIEQFKKEQEEIAKWKKEVSEREQASADRIRLLQEELDKYKESSKL